ncbi:MAG: chemotaxis protein CheV [Nitrospirae bacterium]|nr:chemotaxis protein CheV [Nitrospirota bacterium]MBF0534586.1 chemotaxis protein CheV [Nitrospirota bacterium]MBF0616370.1 chemotaxis protein CheV [Nitrospirota bacterium]
MSELMEEVNQRTNLAASNQMEMLTFFLSDGQLYGINVFKIIEVIECPSKITKMPNSHPSVKGTINFRGKAITTIDLSDALGMGRFDYKATISYVIICEYNQSVHGFLIKEPNALINKSWSDIKSPSSVMGKSAYLTALTYIEEDKAVQILDIEKILGEIIGIDDKISDKVKEELIEDTVNFKDYHVLVVDDSRAARTMVQSVLEQIGLTYTLLDSAVTAYQMLEDFSKDTILISDRFHLIISDIEMPGLDGFSFVRRIKENPKLSSLYVVLHSSMTGESNVGKAMQAGADDFIGKFDPDKIAGMVRDRITSLINKKKSTSLN